MRVERITAEQGSLLRRLRLLAIADAPYAFSATLEETKSLPSKTWEEDAARYASSPEAVCFMTYDGNKPIGMAGAVLQPDEPCSASFFGLWIDPPYRHRGVATMLVKEVAAWARRQHARQLQVWATGHNHPALSFYCRSGFKPTGQRQPYKPDPQKHEVLLSLDLQINPRNTENATHEH